MSVCKVAEGGGLCRADAPIGVICVPHWDRVTLALHRAGEIIPVLDRGPARAGEKVRGSTVPGLPVSLPIMAARDALDAAVRPVLDVVLPGARPRGLGAVVRALEASSAVLRASWVAPELLERLEPAVTEAWRVVDIPRGRLMVPAPCPGCGGSPLHQAGWLLVCDRCGRQSSVGEVRRGV